MLGIETIKITPQIMARACRVEAFRGFWTALERHSNELQLIEEVTRHGRDFTRAFGPVVEQPLTPLIIRHVHNRFVARASGPTPYKTAKNMLEIAGAGELETAAPEQADALMNKLTDWLNDALEEGAPHPLIVIGVFTAVFLQVSPFETGNMRVARVLILFLLLKSGYSYAPYERLDRRFYARAEAIYSALKHNQDSLEAGRPDWSRWLECFLGLMEEQADAVRALFARRDEKNAPLPELSTQILAQFRTPQKRLSMRQLIGVTNGRRSTMKLRLGELVDEGYLRRHGGGRSTYYTRA